MYGSCHRRLDNERGGAVATPEMRRAGLGDDWVGQVIDASCLFRGVEMEI